MVAVDSFRDFLVFYYSGLTAIEYCICSYFPLKSLKIILLKLLNLWSRCLTLYRTPNTENCLMLQKYENTYKVCSLGHLIVEIGQYGVSMISLVCSFVFSYFVLEILTTRRDVFLFLLFLQLINRQLIT